MKQKILLLLFFIPYFLFSQEYIYKEFGLNEGLPSLQVYNIYQDKNGIVWFATDRGVANYNGYEIRSFGVEDGLLSNVILSFYPQPDGRVYCSTFDNTLFYFDADFKGFKPYKYNSILTKTLKHNQTIQNIYFDKKENLFISSIFKIGRLVINNKGVIVENIKKPFPSYVNGEVSYSVYEKYDKTLFYYVTDDVSKLGPQSVNVFSGDGKIEIIELPDSEYLVYRNEYDISVRDKNGKLIAKVENSFKPLVIKAIDSSHFFIGYLFGGGSIVDIKGKITASFLKDQSVTNFLIDREGGYWFTTLYSGVFYIKESKIRVYRQNSIDIPIYSLTKNKNNELFVGYDNGRILKIDRDNNSSVYFNSNNMVRSFMEHDSHTGYSLSFYQNQLIKNKKQPKVESYQAYVLKFSESAEKGILVSQLGGIYQVDLNGSQPERLIKLPFRAHDACYWKDDIYIGTPQGVYVYTPDGKLKALKSQNKLFGNRIDDIDYNEKRNELYFASLGQGLIIYDKTTEKVTSITKKDGLFSDIVNEVHIENENEIWICTNSGLNKITFGTDGKFKLTGLKSSHGLLNDGISDVEIINDRVWIASKKGLAYAPKELFEGSKKNTDYLLRLKQVLVNEKETSPEYLSGLSYDENRIEFNFEAVSLKNEGRLVYNYKLEGLDKKWYSTKNRKVTFSSLPHGDYVFKIAAKDPNVMQNASFLEIPIHIKAPFWKEIWFVILSVVVLLCIVYFFFKLRVLSYNKDITRELLRILVRKIKRKENYFVFKEAGRDIRIKTDTILYVKSSGNYIELVTENKTYVVRCKIGDFIDETPDSLEYLRIHRSYIVRIDKVDTKSKTEVIINGEKLPVSASYNDAIDNLVF
ncbi:ligand-binding sensor domain-containing protein [Flavobacterium sp. 28YEA47A]|uniref:ligand-binding sensor domain-containing protein n=1 Tax=Flavobacterium sp. 28YEA47A TaxID=3156276 RepID=UPI0035195B19